MRENTILTPEEVAQILNVSVVTLRNWRQQKKNLPFERRGKFAVYKTSDVEAFRLHYHKRFEVAN